MDTKKKDELFRMVEHLVYQRLEYSDYYEEEVCEYDYTEEEMKFILDNIYYLLKEIMLVFPEKFYEDFNL